jgi:hypothetical protein
MAELETATCRQMRGVPKGESSTKISTFSIWCTFSISRPRPFFQKGVFQQRRARPGGGAKRKGTCGGSSSEATRFYNTYSSKRAAQYNARVPDSTGACKFRFCISLCCLFHWEPGFHPPLLAFGIVRHVGVAHRRQFTGSVFAGVSMRVRTVGDDFRVLVG